MRGISLSTKSHVPTYVESARARSLLLRNPSKCLSFVLCALSLTRDGKLSFKSLWISFDSARFFTKLSVCSNFDLCVQASDFFIFNPVLHVHPWNCYFSLYGKIHFLSYFSFVLILCFWFLTLITKYGNYQMLGISSSIFWPVYNSENRQFIA